MLSPIISKGKKSTEIEFKIISFLSQLCDRWLNSTQRKSTKTPEETLHGIMFSMHIEDPGFLTFDPVKKL